MPSICRCLSSNCFFCTSASNKLLQLFKTVHSVDLQLGPLMIHNSHNSHNLLTGSWKPVKMKQFANYFKPSQNASQKFLQFLLYYRRSLLTRPRRNPRPSSTGLLTAPARSSLKCGSTRSSSSTRTPRTRPRCPAASSQTSTTTP